MSTATFGTANEDNAHLSKSEQQNRTTAVARPAGLPDPARCGCRFWLTIAMVVLSQAARVAGPALIAFGIDHALPGPAGRGQHAAGAHRRRLPDGGRRNGGSHGPVRHLHGEAEPVHAAGPAASGSSGTPNGSAWSSTRSTPRAGSSPARPRTLRRCANSSIPASARWPPGCCSWCSRPSRYLPSTGAAGSSCWPPGVPMYLPGPLVPEALADRLPRIPGGVRAADRALRGDHDRHPGRQGLPQGARRTPSATASCPRTTAGSRSAPSTSTASSSRAWC